MEGLRQLVAIAIGVWIGVGLMVCMALGKYIFVGVHG